MKYADISAQAVWRFLIDPSQIHRLIKWMALVVCRFKPETNEVHPLENIRQLPQVKGKPGVDTSRDWRGLKFPQMGSKEGYNPSNIEKHMALKRESSIENIAAQHPFLSPSKAKQVDRWIDRDASTQEILQNGPTKLEPGFIPTAVTPSVLSSHDQERLRSHTGRPDGLKTRLAVMPNGELTNPRRKPFPSQGLRHIDKGFDKRSEPSATSISITDPKESLVPSWRVSKPTYDRLLIHEQHMRAEEPSRPAASASLYANQTELILPDSSLDKDSTLAIKEGNDESESGDLLIDLEPELESATLKIEQIKDKIRSTFSPEVQDPKPPSASGELVDLDIPAILLSDPQAEHVQYEKKQCLLKEMVSLRPEAPREQIASAQEYIAEKRDMIFNRNEERPEHWLGSPASHGKIGSQAISSQGTPRGRTIYSAPTTPSRHQLDQRDARLESITERGSRPSSTPASGPSGPSLSMLPVKSPIASTSTTVNFTCGERTVDKSEESQPRLFKEEEKILLDILHNVIEKEHIGGAASVTHVTQDLPTRFDDFPFSTPVPNARPLIDDSLSAPTTAHLQGTEDVPFLHPDLIDLSPESLTTEFCHDRMCQSDQSPADHGDELEVKENIAETEETETREFHETMFHQQPFGFIDNGLDGVNENTKSRSNARHQDSKTSPLGRTTANIGAEREPKEIQEQRSTIQPSNPIAKLTKESLALLDSTKTFFKSMGPLLDRVRIFPGVFTLEIYLGLVSIVNATASTQEREMTYQEVQDLFFSQHSLEPPSTSFFDRLTSSPADIDYLVGMKIKDKPLFDQKVSFRGIRYEFDCTDHLAKAFTISVDPHKNTTIRRPRINLGSVSMSFPAQVWDASAVIHGFAGFSLKPDSKLGIAVKKMVDSIWIDPESQTFQMLLRPPPGEILKINAIVVERRTSHRWMSEQSKQIYLKVTETQVPSLTRSVLDSDILVATSASHEEMIKHGKKWWQASITSVEVENALKPKKPIKLGTCNDLWDASDLLGADIRLLDPTAELSTLGTTIGQSGIGAMFRLAKIVVEEIDAIGSSNQGPAYRIRNTTDRGASTNIISAGARSGTVAQSQDWNMALVKLTPPPEMRQKKRKW
jgi:hypothetical protein